DELEDVDHRPQPPREEAGELHAADAGDGPVAADRRHAALVNVAEARVGLAPGRAMDVLRDVLAGLDRNRGNGRQRLALRTLDRRGVADHEDLRVTGDEQLG